MDGEIVSVGTELLLGHVVDTHSAFMARVLAECGINCMRRATVGDNLDRIVAVLKEALGRADVVITIGGLGPTVDDLTRDAIAEAMGQPLETVPEVEERLKRFFSMRKLPWSESIARQAQKPAGSELVENPFGTAPGLYCRSGSKTVIALPGPKGEFEPMAEGPVRDILARFGHDGVLFSRTLRIVGLGESHVEDLVRDLMEGTNPTLAPYAHTGEVHLRLTARAETAKVAEGLIQPIETEIRARLGTAVFGADETSLEKALLDLLSERDETLAVAESMTGGELGARLTSVPGSSKTFRGGVIAYSMSSKVSLLAIDEIKLREFGPVSEYAARAMAEGVRRELATTWGLSVTGNAGPNVDDDGKPVGLVYVGLAGPEGVSVEETKYRGIREDIRRRAEQLAFSLLRSCLLKS